MIDGSFRKWHWHKLEEGKKIESDGVVAILQCDCLFDEMTFEKKWDAHFQREEK